MKYRGKKKYQVGGLTQSILDRMNQYNSGRTGDIQNLAPKPYKQIEKIIPKPKQPKEIFVGPAPVLNYGEQKAREKYRAKKLQEFVDKNPEYKLNEFGEPTMSPYGIFIQKYGDNLDKFAGSMETPLAIQGAGDLLYGVGKLGAKYLPQVGEYLTTQTPLKNTYKYNPWAFKPNPEAFYRQIGETGIKDALEFNVIRSADKYRFPRPHFVEGKDFEKLYSTGSGAHGRPSVIFETSGVNKEGLPFVNPVNANSSYTPWVADMPEVPLSEGKILQKDWLKGYKEVPKPVSKEQGGNITMNYRGKKCMKCGGKPKMQLAGEVQCPPGFKSDGFGNCIPDEPQKFNTTNYAKLPSEKINISIPEIGSDIVMPMDFPESNAGLGYRDRVDEGIAKGIISGKKDEDGNEGNARDQYNAIHEEKDKEPQPKLDPYWLFRGFRNGMSWLSGMVERGRQNRYDWMQQTALGQMNPMPTDDFQPNPYNLYMQKGGNLKTIIKDYNKYTNDAQMDMGDGKLDDKGMMKKGGYEIDRMIITRKILPQLLQFGRLGTSKYRGMKKGGIYINPENKGKFTASAKEHGMSVQEFARHVLANKEEYSPTQVKRANFARNASKWNRKAGGLTPNKARQILHDKEVHGKPLTDKQRRYFGAMSKGHTNFRGK